MKHFKVQELVSEGVYNALYEHSLSTIDNRIITFLESLREALGKPITVNTWHVGGNLQWRGLRTKDSPWYSEKSQHSVGKAVDFDLKGMSAEEVRQWLITNRNLPWVKCIGFIEDGTNWVHVDVRDTPDNALWLWHVDTHKTKVYKRD